MKEKDKRSEKENITKVYKEEEEEKRTIMKQTQRITENKGKKGRGREKKTSKRK